MKNSTLEKTANETTGSKKTRTTECNYCFAELRIPTGTALKKNTDYGKFYVSPGGGIYCNKDCFNMFTED